MSAINDYYERYWENPRAAPPSSDPTTPVRMAMLEAATKGGLRGGRALDVGCGGGEFTEFLRTLGYDPIGLDMSERAVAFAQHQFPELEFMVGGPEVCAASHGGQFKIVWASEVVEHVFDLYGFLTAVHRCLAPGGRFIITCPYHGLLKNVLIDLAGYANHYNPFGGHIRFFDKTSLGNCLTHCGFKPIRWSGIGRVWPLYRSFFVVAEKGPAPLAQPAADA